MGVSIDFLREPVILAGRLVAGTWGGGVGLQMNRGWVGNQVCH